MIRTVSQTQNAANAVPKIDSASAMPSILAAGRLKGGSCISGVQGDRPWHRMTDGYSATADGDWERGPDEIAVRPFAPHFPIPLHP